MKSLVVLLAVCSAFAGVHSFFGRQLAVPNFETQLMTAWANGAVHMQQLNDQMLAKMAQDGLGVYAVVQPMMLTISESIGGLIKQIVDDIVNQDGNTAGLMTALRADITVILAQLTEAKATITAMGGVKIRASIATAIGNNFSRMFSEVSTLKIIMNEFEAFLNSLDNGNPTVEQEADQIVNIATVIATVRHFRQLRMAFHSLASNLSLLIQVRNAAIDAQGVENSTVIAGVNYVTMNLPTDFNQTTSTVLGTLMGNSQMQMSAINGTFSDITLNPTLYNQGDISNLTAYLANVTNTINNCYGGRMPNLTQELQEDVTYVLNRKATKLANFLITLVRNITDEASYIASPQATNCVNSFTGQMLSTPADLTNLKQCVVPEKLIISDIFNRANEILKTIVKFAGIPNDQMAMCSSKSGTCAKRMFANFPHYNAEMRSFIVKSMKGIAEELELSMVRIDVCVRAVADDIQEFAETQRNAFVGCVLPV